MLRHQRKEAKRLAKIKKEEMLKLAEKQGIKLNI